MGWIKVAVGLGLGIYSYRSVARVNSLVKQIHVPNSSLLGRHTISQIQHKEYRDYKDAYKISLPPHYKILKNTGSSDELFVHDFARCFFSSKLFDRFEAPIIKNLLLRSGSVNDSKLLNYKSFKFKQNDGYLLWTVVGRDTNEILMRWELGGFQGTTWFHIPHNENCLVFGSSFPQPNDKSSQYISIPTKLYIDSRRDLPQDAPVALKVRSALVRGLTRVVTEVHRLYSKYLLLSAYNRIIAEEQRRLNKKS